MMELHEDISLNELKSIIKEIVNDISLEELYELSYQFNEDNKYLPREYRKKHTESVLNVIMNRFIMLKNDTSTYKGKLKKEEIENINQILKNDKNKRNHILNIIAIYTTYLLEEPIHTPNTTFPGLKSIYFDGNDYYCPIKKFHINNKKALCKYCIAKVTE
ncbi:MAG: DUF2115 family protein [Methanosphaera sp.]|nr:DUF2115 family protein [Methanosphaera sp.]